jgi:hypothetical protein
MDRFHLNTFFIFRLDFLFFSFYAISKVFLGIFFYIYRNVNESSKETY